MLLNRVKGAWKVIAETYTLTFAHDRPFVYIEDSQNRRLAELFVLSGVHPLQGRDDTVRVSSWEVKQFPQEMILSLSAESSVWKRKTCRFRCQPGRFTYELEVEGSGHLFEVDYFGGYSSAYLRWGSGFFWSGQYFKQGFNCAPNANEVNYFPPGEGSEIELMGVPLPGKSNWFFTPPPFWFGFEGHNGWLGLGVEAEPGGNRFTEYRYHGGRQSFYLTLSYEGHTTVDGCYRLPAIGFDFGSGVYELLGEHVSTLRNRGFVPQPSRRLKPAWWHEPIFCGWGAQSYLAEVERGRAPHYSRQSNYEKFLRTLEEHDINPGIVVLDDKWQATYGENRADRQKWPDLRGFVDGQHARGRKVLLWLKAWDPEGVPAGECITNTSGMALAVDPSNPAFEKRLRDSVRWMLSPEGYGADGFKIDFTGRIPSGPGIQAHGDVWGLELMKLYLQIIYDEAKQIQPEALIMAHTPHPYLADVLDMVRLNDINKDKDILAAMTLRAHVARIACPEAIIDTDNWPIKDRAAWRSYLRLQPQLGVPSLYFTSHIDSSREPLEPEDYQLIRQVWAEHRSGTGASSKNAKNGRTNKKQRIFSGWNIWRPLRMRRKPALKSAW